jgi:hypothetical protein
VGVNVGVDLGTSVGVGGGKVRWCGCGRVGMGVGAVIFECLWVSVSIWKYECLFWLNPYEI